MISALIKLFLATIYLIISFSMLVSIYLGFIVLDRSYIVKSLNQDGAYGKIANILNKEGRIYILDQITKSQNSSLTSDQRRVLEENVDGWINFITRENVAEFFDKNVGNMILYMRDDVKNWYVYLPLEKWGITQKLDGQIPDYLKTTNIDLKILLESQNQNKQTKAVVDNLRYTYKNTLLFSGVSFLSTFFILLFYSFVSRKKFRESVGALLTFTGIFYLLIAWFFQTLTTFTLSSSGSGDFFQYIVKVLLPVFARPLSTTFTVYGILTFFLGIILFNRVGSSQKSSVKELSKKEM